MNELSEKLNSMKEKRMNEEGSSLGKDLKKKTCYFDCGVIKAGRC